MARGMEMVSKVLAASIMMVLPGLGGQWLDRRWHTSWLVLAGFAFGISVSIYYLIVITRVAGSSDKNKSSQQNKSTNRGEDRR